MGNAGIRWYEYCKNNFMMNNNLQKILSVLADLWNLLYIEKVLVRHERFVPILIPEDTRPARDKE